MVGLKKTQQKRKNPVTYAKSSPEMGNPKDTAGKAKEED